jgi:hypothetical protein
VAAAAAALVLLDGYAIALEQYVMADTFFAFTVLVACLLLAWPALAVNADGRPAVGSRRALVAGLLVAFATLERLEGLFVIPIVIGYLAWLRVGWRPLLACVIGMAIPLLTYSSLEWTNFDTFGLSQWSGWTAYGRVAGFANCRGAGIPSVARALCETRAQRTSHPDASIWYLFDPASPAIRKFGEARSTATQRHSDSILEDFAIRIAVHQPLATLSAVSTDFLRFFEPDTAEAGDASGATVLPSKASAEYVDTFIQHRYARQVRPTVDAPASALRVYRSVIHTPRPLLAVLALASVLAIVLRLSRRRETLLFAGSGLALLAGTAATAGFAQRYVLCAVPLLAIGGTLALRDFLRVALVADSSRGSHRLLR